MSDAVSTFASALAAPEPSARLQAALAALAAGTEPRADDVDLLVARCAVEPAFQVREMLAWALTRHDRAAAEAPRIMAGDLNDALAGLAAQAPSDATLPGHWLSVEGQAVVPGITPPDDAAGESADFVLALDGDPLALVQPHGKAMRWLTPR
ncbi:MAG: hypothetical protein ACTMIR_12910 [Cellulomonadaceae bacterium]